MQGPGSIKEHRASRQRRDKGHRVPFIRRWFVSLGKQRNERKSKAFLGLRDSLAIRHSYPCFRFSTGVVLPALKAGKIPATMVKENTAPAMHRALSQ